jgi:hypothetical protein
MPRLSDNTKCHSCDNLGYWIDRDYADNQRFNDVGRFRSPRSRIVISLRKVICTCKSALNLKLDALDKFNSLKPGDVIRSTQTNNELTVTHAAISPDGYVRAVGDGEIRHLRVESFLLEDWILWKRTDNKLEVAE